MLKKPPLAYATTYKIHGSQAGAAKPVLENSQPIAVASRHSTVRPIIHGSWAISSSSLESVVGAVVATDGLIATGRSIIFRLGWLALIAICLSIFVASKISAS